MDGLASRVKVLPVSVTIHWPTVACALCGGDIITLQDKPPLYQCLSCEEITEGRTQTIEGKATAMSPEGAAWLAHRAK